MHRTPRSTESPPSLSPLMRLLQIRPGELLAVLVSFGYFFFLLAGYFVLRPVRDAMGIAAGVENLQWLFTGTFFAMLAVLPVYGWVSGRFRRSRFVPWVYGFFIVNILGFYAGFLLQPDNPWLAGTFYIWISVLNLFMVSVFWSVMADFFDQAQARRLFGFIAAGGSAGALTGPAITAAFVDKLGIAQLMLISAALLALALCLLLLLIHRVPMRNVAGTAELRSGNPIGGTALAGLTLLFRSPYLASIVLFILLLTSVATFLYFTQATLIRDAFATSEQRTQVFALMDLAVNLIAFTCQFFITGRIATRLGVGVTLALVPALLAVGMFALALSPVLAVLIFVQVARRAGHHAITRPGREMLFTIVDGQTKYKAKNAIDTMIYRGGDMLSGWTYAGMAALGLGLGGIAFVGALLAVALAACGLSLGRQFNQRTVAAAPAGATARPVAQ